MKSEILYSLNESCTYCGEQALVAWAPTIMVPVHVCKHCAVKITGKLLQQEEEWGQWTSAIKEV